MAAFIIEWPLLFVPPTPLFVGIGAPRRARLSVVRAVSNDTTTVLVETHKTVPALDIIRRRRAGVEWYKAVENDTVVRCRKLG